MAEERTAALVPVRRPAPGSAARPLLAARLWERRAIDAAVVAAGFVVLLLGIPARLVFAPLGAVGTPAAVVGIAALGWWGTARLVAGSGADRRVQPVRYAGYLFATSILVSYLAATTRPADGDEIIAADRGMLYVLFVMGVLLLVADGVRDRRGLDLVLSTLVVMAGIVAFMGVVQFFTGYDISSLYKIPGLKANVSFGSLNARSDFRRVSGTATHPIEFGVVLAMVFPIALNRAFYAQGARRTVSWACVVLIGVAIPMSLSRSAFLGLGAAMLVIIPTWSFERRMKAAMALPVFAIAMQGLVPGLLGTIKSLFVNLSSDPSYTGRTEDYAVIGRFIAERPWFGRGFSTFDPAKYVLLDNQYLGTIIETGYVGLTVLLLLFLIGIFTARGARRQSRDEETRDLAQSLAGSISVALLGCLTFDALGYMTFSGVLFLLIGCTGALWRLEARPVLHPDPTDREPAAPLADAPTRELVRA